MLSQLAFRKNRVQFINRRSPSWRRPVNYNHKAVGKRAEPLLQFHTFESRSSLTFFKLPFPNCLHKCDSVVASYKIIRYDTRVISVRARVQQGVLRLTCCTVESCDDPFTLSNEDENCISRTSYFAFLFLFPFSLPSRLAYYDFRELKRA